MTAQSDTQQNKNQCIQTYIAINKKCKTKKIFVSFENSTFSKKKSNLTLSKKRNFQYLLTYVANSSTKEENIIYLT